MAAGVGLLHQARQALARGDRQRLYAALLALDGAAVSRGDADTAARTGAALRRLAEPDEPGELRGRSIERSGRELLGEDIAAAVEEAYRRGREAPQDPAPSAESRAFGRAWRQYIGEDAGRATISAALAVDGCFEVGGALSPVRVAEEEMRLRAVRYPTPELLLRPAEAPDEIADAVIEDPRMLLLSLATGRLLSRRFVLAEPEKRTRTVMRSEVRIYVLDGSLSMLGPRARMRDAILVAELATLSRRLSERGRRTRVALFYRYFNEEVGPTTRVDSAPAALAAIRDILATPRRGGTDIEKALLASFEQLRAARDQDPELYRAQIVLVTDGEAAVREDVIAWAREAMGDLPIGVSVIALGEENEALRGLVARARARGERAFYHFIGDEELARICDGEIDRGPPIHLAAPAPARPAEEAQALTGLVGDLLEELAALGRGRDIEALERLAAEEEARGELGLSPQALGEGERARREALHKDHRALALRFARWFPEAPAAGATRDGAPTQEEQDAVLVLVATVTEITEVVGGSELAKRSDAIDVLERLLPDARLTPSRYAAVLAAPSPAVAAALKALHAAVRGPAARA